jgi:hypothetical protein
VVTALVVFIVGFCIYFLPSIVAFRRDRHNKGAILVLNMFLGWSVIGWVIAMVWAVSSSQPVVVQGQDPPKS